MGRPDAVAGDAPQADPAPVDAPTGDARTAAFERARPRLAGVAFRLLGTMADAEDAVQETWIRWARLGAEVPDNPDAWLTTVVTRVALDQLRRRTRDRDRYVGPWLPTPVITLAGVDESSTDHRHDPEAAAELADSLTTAYLLMLERLTPDERAAFLLADVFGEPYRVVAAALGRNEPACRKLASRARSKLRQDTEPTVASASGSASAPTAAQDHRRVVDRFLVAIATGDEADALACVGTEAVLVSDGGPHRRAARHPVLGPDRIVRLLTNLARRMPPDWVVEPAMVGGLAGVVATDPEGTVELAIGFVVRDEVIDRAYVVVSPDKLAGARTGPLC